MFKERRKKLETKMIRNDVIFFLFCFEVLFVWTHSNIVQGNLYREIVYNIGKEK